MVEIRLRKDNTVCEFQLDLSEIKLPNDFVTLQDLEKEVENSIFHLKKSNEEIKKFDPDGKDTDLLLAFNENIFALSKKERRLEMIREKMKTLGAQQQLATVQIHPTSSLLLNDRKLLKEESKNKPQQNITEIENISNSSELNESISDVLTDVLSDVEKEARNKETSENDSVKKRIAAGIKRKTEDCIIRDENGNLINDTGECVPIECEKRKKSSNISDSVTEDGIFL